MAQMAGRQTVKFLKVLALVELQVSRWSIGVERTADIGVTQVGG